MIEQAASGCFIVIPALKKGFMRKTDSMFGKNNIQLIFVLAILLTTLGIHRSSYAATQTQVNLILDGKIVLIYHGKEAGYEKGQQLNVVRDGKVVGTLEVTEVKKAYVQAEITSAPDSVREGDLVTAAKGVKKTSSRKSKKTTEKKSAAGRSSGSKEKTKSESTESSTKAKTSSRSSRKRSRTSSKSDSTEASSDSSTKSGGTRSRRSRRGSSSSKSSSDDEESGSTKSRRGRRGGSSSKSASVQDKTKEEKKQEEPKMLGAAPHYSLHIGYFYLNSGDLPGSVVSESPAPVVSVDYWVPRRKNMNLYYSILYSRPKVETYYNDQRIDFQLRMIQFMGGLVWDNLNTSFGNDIYGGFAAGWRNASYEIHCSVSCDGINDVQKKSMEGMDYNGILGVRFREKSEVKFLYSFDEQYYTIDYGIRY